MKYLFRTREILPIYECPSLAPSGQPRAAVWVLRGLALLYLPAQAAPGAAVKAQLLFSCEADG